MIVIVNKRIPKYGKEIRRFAKWLTSRHPLAVTLQLRIVSTQCLDDDVLLDYGAGSDGEFYGLFDHESITIVLAVGGVDCTLALIHLAHEYYHAMQFLGGKVMRENDADAWSASVMLDYQGGF